MPSLSEVVEYRKTRFESSMDLIARKGADYNRDQQENGDTLFNLRVAEILGIVPSTEEGILVRLSDKFMRLISLCKPGREAMVKDESVEDTINDIHNYVDYLGLIWKQRKMRMQKAKVPFETLGAMCGSLNPIPRTSEDDPRVDLRPKTTAPVREVARGEGYGTRGY